MDTITTTDLEKAKAAWQRERCLWGCQIRLKKQVDERKCEHTDAEMQAAVQAMAWVREDELTSSHFGRAETVMPEMANPQQMQQALKQTASEVISPTSLPSGQMLSARA